MQNPARQNVLHQNATFSHGMEIQRSAGSSQTVCHLGKCALIVSRVLNGAKKTKELLYLLIPIKIRYNYNKFFIIQMLFLLPTSPSSMHSQKLSLLSECMDKKLINTFFMPFESGLLNPIFSS